MNECANLKKAANVKEESKQIDQTLKVLIATINARDNDSKIDKMRSSVLETENSTIDVANNPPLKTPICFSTNKVEIRQTLGNYTFAAPFEADELLQKILKLMKISDTTKNIHRRPRGARSFASSQR